jgi:hypothetical protein
MMIPEGQEEQKGESGEATHVKLSACEVSSHNQTSQIFQASSHTNSPEAAITLTTISEEQDDDGSSRYGWWLLSCPFMTTPSDTQQDDSSS